MYGEHVLISYLLETIYIVEESILIHSVNYVANCKGVGCASGVGLPLAALNPSFLDKRVGTGPASA